MGLEARIGKLESADGMGTCRPCPAAWGGTPEQDKALRRLVAKNPLNFFARLPEDELAEIRKENSDEFNTAG